MWCAIWMEGERNITQWLVKWIVGGLQSSSDFCLVMGWPHFVIIHSVLESSGNVNLYKVIASDSSWYCTTANLQRRKLSTRTRVQISRTRTEYSTQQMRSQLPDAVVSALIFFKCNDISHVWHAFILPSATPNCMCTRLID